MRHTEEPLPPLPEAINGIDGPDGPWPLFTEDQLRDFAKLAVREALERAAVCAWSTGMDEYAGTLGLS